MQLENVFHFIAPLALCLAGFHGVFFHGEPWKKTASWCAFQAGLIVFLLQLASRENPFPVALALSTLACTAAVVVLLSAFCVKSGGRLKPPEAGKNSRRGSR
jgi:hypothetical protein